MNRGLRDALSFAGGIGFGVLALSVLSSRPGAQSSGSLEMARAEVQASGGGRSLAAPTQVAPRPVPVSHRQELDGAADGSAAAEAETFAPPGMVEMLQSAMPTDAELERRYGEMSLPELIGARKGLSYVVHSEATAFLEQKMERGLYTTQVIAVGTPLSHDGRFPDGSPRMFLTKTHTLPDGTAEVWTADIHQKEQPLLERRHAELAWLGARIHRMQKERQ